MPNALGLFLVLLTAFLVRLPILLGAGNFLDLDEATFALMAKRLLEGELSLYFWGQSYMGSFAAYAMAPWIALLGMTALPVKLTVLCLFLLFLAVNWILMNKIAGPSVAVFASLFLIFMPPFMLDMSLRALGGYAELWVFQAAVLLILHELFRGSDETSRPKLLFLLGLLIGLMLWVNELSLVYIFPFLVYYLVWDRKSFRTDLLEGIRLKGFPNPWRYLLLTWHGLVILFFAAHFAALFLSKAPWPLPSAEKFFDFFGAVPPFQMKILKRFLLLLAAEFFLVQAVRPPSGSRLRFLKNCGFFIGGFLPGHLPALVFDLTGGEGLRIFHGSGAVPLSGLADRLLYLRVLAVPQVVFGLERPGAAVNLIAWLVLSAVFLVTAIYYWGKRSRVWIFFLLAAFALAVNLTSTLEAVRYLSPLYLALAGILGFFFGEILWPRKRALALGLAGLLVMHFAFYGFRFYEKVPKDSERYYYEILDYLDSQKIYGGFGSRHLAFILTYLSNRRVVISATNLERYLPHLEYSQSLGRRAYIFEYDDGSASDFRKDDGSFSKVKSEKRFGPFVVYLAEGFKEGPDSPYRPPSRKFPIGLYLNEGHPQNEDL